MAFQPRLDEQSLHEVALGLARRDGALQAVVDRFGPPPLWARPPGFATLLHIILEQQVSLASAQAAFDRLSLQADPLTPQAVLELDDATLRAAGFSRQKAAYARALSSALVSGSLDLDRLAALDDERAMAALMEIKGIGAWTGQIYLLLALRRPDIWPTGDRALAVAAQEVLGLPACPDATTLATLGERWRPWRAVAARVLWHHYLSRKRRA